MIKRLALPLLAFSAPLVAASQPLLPVPLSLNDRAGVVCFWISTRGNVTDAFVVSSTGDRVADADLIDYAKQIKWPVASAKDQTLRNRWIPLPIVMGKAERPTVPDTCEPPRRPN